MNTMVFMKLSEIGNPPQSQIDNGNTKSQVPTKRGVILVSSVSAPLLRFTAKTFTRYQESRHHSTGSRIESEDWFDASHALL